MRCECCPDLSIRQSNPWCERFGRPVITVADSDCSFVPVPVQHIDWMELVRRAQEIAGETSGISVSKEASV